MDDLPRFRLVARERGLRRASRVTGWVAVGGVAATMGAAVVFAGSTAAGNEDPVPPPPPGPTAVPPVGPVPGPAVAPSTAPQARHRSRTTAGGASDAGGTALQPPVAAPRPASGRHAHVSSGAS